MKITERLCEYSSYKSLPDGNPDMEKRVFCQNRSVQRVWGKRDIDYGNYPLTTGKIGV